MQTQVAYISKTEFETQGKRNTGMNQRKMTRKSISDSNWGAMGALPVADATSCNCALRKNDAALM